MTDFDEHSTARAIGGVSTEVFRLDSGRSVEQRIGKGDGRENRR